jgi:putative flippase GtrA
MRASVNRMWTGLNQEQRAFLRQIVRYGVVGVGVTSFQIAVYNLLIGAGHRPPLLATVLATALAMAVGYTIHSRYTFDGHGERGNTAREAVRFVVANLVGLALNSLWVWLFTRVFGLSAHLVSLPMFFATPIALFWLNRVWVFG